MAGGYMKYPEIPAGMTDGDTIGGTVINEIEEETGINVNTQDNLYKLYSHDKNDIMSKNKVDVDYYFYDNIYIFF